MENRMIGHKIQSSLRILFSLLSLKTITQRISRLTPLQHREDVPLDPKNPKDVREFQRILHRADIHYARHLLWALWFAHQEELEELDRMERERDNLEDLGDWDWPNTGSSMRPERGVLNCQTPIQLDGSDR